MENNAQVNSHSNDKNTILFRTQTNLNVIDENINKW